MKNTNALGYQMSQKMFDAIVKGRKGNDKKKNPYTYVMEIINEQFGLRGEVKHITLVQ